MQLPLLALLGTLYVKQQRLVPLALPNMTPCCCWVSCREAAACQIYDELVTAAAGSSARGNSAAASPRPTTGPLPWLYYVEDVDLQRVAADTKAQLL